ncbi:MAG: hypothetical protein ACP5MD_12715 [Verrucomicrobiia bacterium]
MLLVAGALLRIVAALAADGGALPWDIQSLDQVLFDRPRWFPVAQNCRCRLFACTGISTQSPAPTPRSIGAVVTTPIVADWGEEQEPVLRITAHISRSTRELEMEGPKLWGHRIVLSSTTDLCR